MSIQNTYHPKTAKDKTANDKTANDKTAKDNREWNIVKATGAT